MALLEELQLCEVIIGNSNSRFSGVTSTMLQTLAVQKTMLNVRVLGKHHLEDPSIAISFWQVVFHLRKSRQDGTSRIFHARRNDEMIQALLLKRLFGVPLKIVFTSTAQRHHSRFTRWLMSQMDAVISTCQAAASYLVEPPKAIIAHGVQSEVYQPAVNRGEELCRLGIATPYAIGMFGRVREQKGVHLFVNACVDILQENPDYTAVIVGAITPKNKDFVDKLKQKIDQAKLSERILFLGEQAFKEIPGLFRSMSLIAALSNNEGFGLTVLEAMSSGAAVLATEAGAWPEILDQGRNGYVVPVNDQQAITAALSKLLSDPAKLEHMGKLGRAKVLEEYTVEREAKQLCDFYRSLNKPI